MNSQRSSYPLRFNRPSLRDEAEAHARKNVRSLNSELCVLINEALEARKANDAAYKKA